MLVTGSPSIKISCPYTCILVLMRPLFNSSVYDIVVTVKTTLEARHINLALEMTTYLTIKKALHCIRRPDCSKRLIVYMFYM